MINLIKNIILILIIGLSSVLLYQKFLEKKVKVASAKESTNFHSKSEIFKKYLIQFRRPERIEIQTLTEKFKSDIEEIKALKMPLDKNSNYYMKIQLFSDFGDAKAPLVMQVKFLSLQNSSLLDEKSINLE